MGRWKVGASSVIGQSHVDRDKPCQDSSLVQVIPCSDGSQVLLAAVSDGAGSASHSQIGSQIVCKTFAGLAAHTLAHTPAQLWHKQFFEAWFKVCHSELDREAQKLQLPKKQLAATALLAIVAEQQAIFFQIGDGGIVVSSPLDEPIEYSWVFWPDKGEEYVNLATFITTKDALSKADCVYCQLPIDRLSIFSDGIEHAALANKEKAVHGQFFNKCFDYFAQPHGELNPSQRLEQVLGSQALAQKSDDDKSLVLALR